jgi:hypothetical protein
MARTAEVATRLSRILPTIPTITWRTHGDIARWARWLVPSSPPAIAVDLSTLKRTREWTWGLDGIQALSRALTDIDPIPRLVAIGPSAPARVTEVVAAWRGHVTIASRHLWQLSGAGTIQYPDGTREKSLDLDFGERLARNVAHLMTAIRLGAGSLRSA